MMRKIVGGIELAAGYPEFRTMRRVLCATEMITRENIDTAAKSWPPATVEENQKTD